MTGPDFPPEVIELAAEALSHHADNGLQAEDIARAVLAAVADDLRAEGAAEATQKAARLLTDESRAYQRGMVAGARQVRDAVEERVALWPSMAGRTDYREGVSQATAALLTAAREAVARIENKEN